MITNDLILVCGPPGIGKSTFCTKLKEYLMINDDNIIVTIISFDDHVISKSEWNERSFTVGRFSYSF